MKKRFLVWLLVLCLLVSVMPTVAWAEEVTSGSCGESATWSFDEATGTLTISGTGEMTGYGNDVPWRGFLEKIAKITIENGITRIGSSAFRDCNSLTSVSIPGSVTSIGSSAFNGCYSLSSITIPDGVTSMGDYVFYGCSSLNNITIPESVTSIGDAAFCGCSSLTSITIPEGVSRIGNDTFFDCERLISITIPDSVTSIGDYAFCNCISLTSIIIPNGVSSVGFCAFSCCESLPGIVIPASVTSISESAFEVCTSLTEIIFAGNAPGIGESIFYEVTATAYYLENNSTWTDHVMQDYGGTITWVPYAEGTTPWDDDQPIEPEPTEPEPTEPEPTEPEPTEPEPTEPEPTEPEPTENPFTDVPSDKYYYDPILWAYENGITAGATANTFNPDGNCTRGQIVTFLWRAEGCPEPKTTNNPFTDVDSDDYFYKAVLWAVENGITAGATKTTFNPKGACDRAQVVTFMWRAAGKPTPTSTKNPFVDVAAGKYYHDAVLWAVENGITSGISATKFAPSNTCTRGQIVTFLYRGYAN